MNDLIQLNKYAIIFPRPLIYNPNRYKTVEIFPIALSLIYWLVNARLGVLNTESI